MAAPTLDELTRVLGLAPHPEGGFFRETFRSTRRVEPADGRGARSALTNIHYLLGSRDVSRWHQVDSDEAWHFYEGAPLELWTLSPDLTVLEVLRLGPLAAGVRHATVPAGWWQAARSEGNYSLVGCTVAPGFDFADFRFASDLPAIAARIRVDHPGAEGLL